MAESNKLDPRYHNSPSDFHNAFTQSIHLYELGVPLLVQFNLVTKSLMEPNVPNWFGFFLTFFFFVSARWNQVLPDAEDFVERREQVSPPLVQVGGPRRHERPQPLSTDQLLRRSRQVSA